MADNSDNADTFWHDKLWYGAVGMNSSAKQKNMVLSTMVDWSRSSSVVLRQKWNGCTKKKKKVTVCRTYLVGIQFALYQEMWNVKKMKSGSIWGFGFWCQH